MSDDDGSLADLGEWGLIAAIARRLPTDPDLIGTGDDAAVVPTPDGNVVISTDVLVEGVHFRPDWASAHDIGARAAAASLADIAAMGARPTALVVAFAAPATTEVSWALGVADGLRDEAASVGAAVVGGDVSAAREVIIAVTAIGDLQGRQPVLRSGAQPGNAVAIAGRLGWAAAGLAVLRRGFGSPRALVAAYRRPVPDYGAGIVAATANATSMCDVSDGLVADLGHIASASGVRIDVWTSHLQVAEPVRGLAAAYGREVWPWVLGGGDDHALVATFVDAASVPQPFTLIGEVTEATSGDDEANQVTVDGHRWVDAENPRGHQHFRQ